MRSFKFAAAAVLVAAGAAVAAPVLITFDDVTAGAIATVPNGYQGFNWSSTGAIDGVQVGGVHNPSGYTNGVVSGTYVGFNEFASVATIDNGLFDFTSGYFTGAWNDDLNVRIVGSLAGIDIYDNTIVVDSDAPTFYLANYIGIDALRIETSGGVDHGYGGGGTHVAFDDLLFNGALIPLPSAAAMGLAGLGLVGFRRRAR